MPHKNTETPIESLALAEKVNETLKKWSAEKPKLVVAIDGYTGIGKTTLLHNLTLLNPNVVPVSRDDFLYSRKVVQEKLSRTVDRTRVFEREIIDNRKLEVFVTTYRNTNEPYQLHTYNDVSGHINTLKHFDFLKSIMVIEGVFLFHPELPINKLWDRRIYLEGDIDKIDRQRVSREKEKWGKDYFPETHPDSYFRQITIGLKRYIDVYKPEEVADVVFKV